MRIDRRGFLTRVGAALAGYELSKAVPVFAASAGEPELYFAETGHHLAGDFLSFWRFHRNGYIFGNPITDAATSRDGWNVQYFENVRLEQAPDTGQVLLGGMGIEVSQRGGAEISNMKLESRFALFASKYDDILGEAIGEPVAARHGYGEYVYTHSALMVHDSNAMPEFYAKARSESGLNTLWPGEVTLWPLGRRCAELYDVDTAGVPRRAGAWDYYPQIFDGIKRIEVNLTEQCLIAHEGDVPVLHAAVSTGKPGYWTPEGDFFTSLKAESLDFVSPFAEAPYVQPKVPFSMLFEHLTYIHGAYWHDEFGRQRGYGRSYGCVNLDLDEAKWLYDWAPPGTPVQIHS